MYFITYLCVPNSIIIFPAKFHVSITYIRLGHPYLYVNLTYTYPRPPPTPGGCTHWRRIWTHFTRKQKINQIAEEIVREKRGGGRRKKEEGRGGK
jgi:hypothetical protein